MVQILADLNGCDKDTIQQILIQGGVPESEFAPKKRRKRQPPAPKPDPAKATAAMPPEDESLPLPFSDDDMGIGDDEYGGAMTGGEGVYDIHDYGSYAAGGFIPPYRTAEELLTEPEDMTDKEESVWRELRQSRNQSGSYARQRLRTYAVRSWNLKREATRLLTF